MYFPFQKDWSCTCTCLHLVDFGFLEYVYSTHIFHILILMNIFLIAGLRIFFTYSSLQKLFTYPCSLGNILQSKKNLLSTCTQYHVIFVLFADIYISPKMLNKNYEGSDQSSDSGSSTSSSSSSSKGRSRRKCTIL